MLFQLSDAFRHRDTRLLIQLSTGSLHIISTFLDIMNNAVMSIWLQILCVRMFSIFWLCVGYFSRLGQTKMNWFYLDSQFERLQSSIHSPCFIWHVHHEKEHDEGEQSDLTSGRQEGSGTELYSKASLLTWPSLQPGPLSNESLMDWPTDNVSNPMVQTLFKSSLNNSTPIYNVFWSYSPLQPTLSFPPKYLSLNFMCL